MLGGSRPDEACAGRASAMSGLGRCRSVPCIWSGRLCRGCRGSEPEWRERQESGGSCRGSRGRCGRDRSCCTGSECVALARWPWRTHSFRRTGYRRFNGRRSGLHEFAHRPQACSSTVLLSTLKYLGQFVYACFRHSITPILVAARVRARPLLIHGELVPVSSCDHDRDTSSLPWAMTRTLRQPTYANRALLVVAGIA